MLSSIHPLGERTRNNRWPLTVGAFALGATIAAATVGGALGVLGSTLTRFDTTAHLVATGLVFLLAGGLDIARRPVPGPKRQVNEHWIGTYRGWVYGGVFGVELGAGVLTYMVTWTVYAVFAAEFLSGDLASGALIGVFFGFGRSIGLILAGRVDRGSRLTAFHSRMAAFGPAVRRIAGYGAAALGILAVAAVSL